MLSKWPQRTKVKLAEELSASSSIDRKRAGLEKEIKELHDALKAEQKGARTPKSRTR